MPLTLSRRLWLSVSLLAALFGQAVSVGAAPAPSSFQDVARVVAIGDVHGDFENYLLALAEADLIDEEQRWSGGATHLVQLGDIAGRGPDAAKIIRHLMQLEEQAEKAGGRVHVLIGNHEAMSILGDLRYINKKVFSSLKTRESRARRKDYYKRFLQARRQVDPKFRMTRDERKAWNEEHPLGWVEHRIAWGQSGEFGSWVLDHPATVIINDTLFVHGGLSPKLPTMTPEKINAAVRNELVGGVGAGGLRTYTEEADSPLWYRGYAYPIGNLTSISEAQLASKLSDYGVSRIVVGHTPGFGTVLPRFDRRVLLADTGISKVYGGYIAALEIIGDQLYLRQAGARTPIPATDGERLAYLKTVADLLESPAKNLLGLIDYLQQESVAAQPSPDEPAQ